MPAIYFTSVYWPNTGAMRCPKPSGTWEREGETNGPHKPVKPESVRGSGSFFEREREKVHKFS